MAEYELIVSNRERYFSLLFNKAVGKYHLSIPVDFGSLASCDEEYEIPESWVSNYPESLPEVELFAYQCRMTTPVQSLSDQSIAGACRSPWWPKGTGYGKPPESKPTRRSRKGIFRFLFGDRL